MLLKNALVLFSKGGGSLRSLPVVCRIHHPKHPSQSGLTAFRFPLVCFFFLLFAKVLEFVFSHTSLTFTLGTFRELS